MVAVLPMNVSPRFTLNVRLSTSSPKVTVVAVLLSLTVTVNSAEDSENEPTMAGAVTLMVAVPTARPVITPASLTLAFSLPSVTAYVTVPV